MLVTSFLVISLVLSQGNTGLLGWRVFHFLGEYVKDCDFFFEFLKKYISYFNYFWLHWIFVVAVGPSLVVVHGLLSHYGGFPPPGAWALGTWAQ